MAGTISEFVGSRRFTVGPTADRELLYTVTGTTDEDEVYALLGATAPATYKGLILKSLGADPLDGGDSEWRGTARYALLETEKSFEIGGSTNHVTQSLATVASYAPAGMTAPDFGGAIGVSDDRVEGVDVPGAAPLNLALTKQFADATVSASFVQALAALAGKSYNNATFMGFPAGTLALLGVTGSLRVDDLWSLTFRFGVSPNVTGLSVGGITGIDKLGWDYLWFRYAVSADTTAFALVHRPVAAYVERVLTPSDYSILSLAW